MIHQMNNIKIIKSITLPTVLIKLNSGIFEHIVKTPSL